MTDIPIHMPFYFLYLYLYNTHAFIIYGMEGKSGRGEIWQIDFVSSILQINRTANRLLIISTNLDGFSLVNHGRFANVSPCQSFPPYGR